MAWKHKHHIVPKHRGGTDDPTNLVEITITQHAMWHYAEWLLHKNEWDKIAWKGLAGITTSEETVLAAYVENGRRRGAKNVETGQLDRIRELIPRDTLKKLGREMGKKYGHGNGKRNIHKLLDSTTTETRRKGGSIQGSKNASSGHMAKIQKELYEDPDHPELGCHNAGNLVRKQKAAGLPSGKDNRVKANKSAET